MATHILWQPSGSNPIYASFAPGIDPYIYGPPLVPTGVPYWFVETSFIDSKQESYGPDFVGWILLSDSDLPEPFGYGA